MEGFDAGTRDLPAPPAELAEETRARLALVVAAIVHQRTPEDIAGYLEDGFPEEITAGIERPGERDEMLAHVDVLLSIAQAPAGV